MFIFLRSTRNTTPTTTPTITSSRTPITAPAIAPPLTAGGGQDLYDKSLFKRIDFSSASARCKKAVLLTHLFPVLSGRRHQQNPRCTSTGSCCYIANGKERKPANYTTFVSHFQWYLGWFPSGPGTRLGGTQIK